MHIHIMNVRSTTRQPLGADSHRAFVELRSDLEQQARWRTGLEGLSTSTHIAFLHIDAGPLKDSLMPVIQHATEQVLDLNQLYSTVPCDTSVLDRLQAI